MPRRTERKKLRTPKGCEIPVPKLGDVVGAFERIAGQPRDRAQDPKATQPGPEPEAFKKPARASRALNI